MNDRRSRGGADAALPNLGEYDENAAKRRDWLRWAVDACSVRGADPPGWRQIVQALLRDAEGNCVVAAEIIARAKWGDRDALAEIFREHHPAVLRYLNGVAIAHAEDVASQVWVDVASSLKRFEGNNDDLRRWLFTIARRRMIDAFRSRSRRPEQSVAELPVRVAVQGTDASTEQVEWAEDVLRRLPPTQAEVVMLRVILGFTVDEVAELIDKTPGAVRVLAHRGLQNVSRLLDADGRAPNGGNEGISTSGVTQQKPAAMERVR